ncbi:mucin-13 [Bufo gargarizans]|uniref:mucin-13 n=1 Tax=Bufo gargarizans TaxID=30331 RepID=UPI001CF1A684|nr:mucin-13 [Bufo gargarizans]
MAAVVICRVRDHTDSWPTSAIAINSLSSSKSQRSRRSSGEVTARVNHVFLKGATTADIKQEIEKNLASFGAYSSKNICDGFYCDPETTDCTETPDGQGAACTCKEGNYSNPSVPEVTSCRDCSPECSQTEGKYCNVDAKTGADCACLPGYKSSGDTCKECEFGYSGEDCADNYLLILVIVGAVLGAVVLALLGAVIGISVSSKKGKKSGDRTTLIERDEPALAGRSPDPTRIFPKVHAKPDLGEVNKAANFYEDNEEFSRNYPKRDYEELQSPWYEMARKDQNY